MKETIKASIGGYVFTLDTDAYEILNAYLNNLRVYFEKKNDGSEILTDIEYRMSELLQIKVNSPTRIITLSDAKEIIEIMGNPVDFDDTDEIKKEDATETKENIITPKKKESRKLYRDTDHAVLGGVCSGLGHYFNLDPVLVRIIYALSFIISISLERFEIFEKLGLIIFFSYFILWIAMPAAKTFNQKLAMSGQEPSIKEIEARNFKARRIHGSGIGRVLGKILKGFIIFILATIGISIFLSAFLAFFFPSVTNFSSVKDFFEVNGIFSYKMLATITLIWLIPSCMAIYLAIRLLMKFNVRDVIVLGVAFVVWLGVCLYIGNWGVKFSRDYKQKASYTEKFIPATESDTIYVKLGDQYEYAEKIFDNNEQYMKDLYVIDEEPKSWFVMPKIEIIKDSIYKNIEIDIQKTAFERNWKKAQDRAERARFNITEQGSRLILAPQLYNKNNFWNREIFKLIIYCPEDKEIVLDHLLIKNSVKNKNRKKGKNKKKILEQKTEIIKDSIQASQTSYQVL